MRSHQTLRHALLPALLIAACAGLVLAACGASTPEPVTVTSSGNAGESTAGGAAATFDFPTGPAVTVPVDYAPPTDHVDSTGAYLPANGKPTLVFVDAIW